MLHYWVYTRNWQICKSFKCLYFYHNYQQSTYLTQRKCTHLVSHYTIRFPSKSRGILLVGNKICSRSCHDCLSLRPVWGLPDMASACPPRAWGDAWLEHHSPCRRLSTEDRHGPPLELWGLDYEALEAALALPDVQHPAWHSSYSSKIVYLVAGEAGKRQKDEFIHIL